MGALGCRILWNMDTARLKAKRAPSSKSRCRAVCSCSPVPEGIGGLETQRSTLMDRRGEGVTIILERSESLSGRRPVYELPDESELRLTIFAADAAEVARREAASEDA